jgi:hypothetical protein
MTSDGSDVSDFGTARPASAGLGIDEPVERCIGDPGAAGVRVIADPAQRTGLQEQTSSQAAPS